MIEGKNIDCMAVDPSAASFITLIKRYGQIKVIPARNNVNEGISEVALALKRGDIKICKNCADSIREFSLYRWQNTTAKDTPVKENDHAMDDIRYFVSTVLHKKEQNNLFSVAVERM